MPGSIPIDPGRRVEQGEDQECDGQCDHGDPAGAGASRDVELSSGPHAASSRLQAEARDHDGWTGRRGQSDTAPRGYPVDDAVRHTRPAVLGELAVLDGGVRSATAEAVDRTTLPSLSRDELVEVLRSEPRVVDAMLRRLTGIARRTTHDLAALAFLDLEGRVARRILAPLARARAHPGRSVGQQEPSDHPDRVAQMVSETRQTVNRALRSLERRGYIEVTDDGIVIRDQKGLQERADQ
jgi:CRP-like cAMP-binding protein